jgi:hypothetical protein
MKSVCADHRTANNFVSEINSKTDIEQSLQFLNDHISVRVDLGKIGARGEENLPLPSSQISFAT